MEETEGWSNAPSPPVMDNPRGEVGAYKIDQRTRIIRLYFFRPSPSISYSSHSFSFRVVHQVDNFLHSPPALLFYFAILILFNDHTRARARATADYRFRNSIENRARNIVSTTIFRTKCSQRTSNPSTMTKIEKFD